MTPEQADMLAARSADPPAPHVHPPAAGSLIRITRSRLPYFRIGDLAVIVSGAFVHVLIADFNDLGNAEVHGRGRWYIGDRFLIVKEAEDA